MENNARRESIYDNGGCGVVVNIDVVIGFVGFVVIVVVVVAAAAAAAAAAVAVVV